MNSSKKKLSTTELYSQNIKEAIAQMAENRESLEKKLQNTNDELYAITESLQSTNSELNDLNEKLNDRNRQVDKSRKFAETIISILHEPLIVLDTNNIITNANTSFYRHFELDAEKTIGKNLLDLHGKAWNVQGLRRGLKKISEEKEGMLEAEITVDFPMGERILCCNFQWLEQEDNEPLILLAMDDITGRKNTEELLKEKAMAAARFSMLANAMPQKMWIAEANGYVNYCNERWTNYTRKSFDELKGIGWEKIIHPDDWSNNKTTWKHSIRTGKDFELEHRFLRYDGVYRWHLSRGRAQKDSKGKVVCWVGTHTDINELKALEERLEKEVTEKEMAAAQKNDFISMASHELKTPITSMKAYTQVLLHKFKDDADASLFLSRMENQINKLTYLVSDLLDTTRVTSGRLRFNEEIFDFNELVEEISGEMKQISKTHVIQQHIGPPVMVFGDRNRIGQVMTNMISNAFKYSPQADNVIITTIYKDHHIKYCVQDFGIGIPKESINNVFDQFFRVTGVEQERFEGLGLGLFIASEIIKTSRGSMSVDSIPGKGSIFSFTLPCKN